MITADWKISDKITVRCRQWLAETPDNDTAILFMHGVESHSEWFEDVAPKLAKKGISVYAPDRPGWGESDGSRGHLKSYEDAMKMFDICSKKILKKHSHIHLVGLSWGGKFSLYAALRRPFLFDTITMIAPGLVAKRSVSAAQKAKIAFDIIFGDGTKNIPLPINPSHFTANTDRSEYIMKDSKRVKQVTTSFCLESLKMDKFIEENIARLRIPAQLLLAENDRIIDNTATSKLFNLAGSLEKKTVFFDNAEHSLVFEDPVKCSDEIARWIAAKQKNTEHFKEIVVMGAGAVGSTIGGLLARGGHKTTLIARNHHVDAINEKGLQLNIAASTQIIRENLTAVCSPEKYGKTADMVILCVKSYDTETALEEIRPIVTKDTILLCLQNGVMNEERIAKSYPENPVIAGAICGYLSFDNPGVITLKSDKGGISVGPWQEKDLSAAAICQAILQDSGMQIDLELSGRRIKWSKLMLNVAFNAINALTGLSTSKIMSDEKLGNLAVKTFAECAAVIKKLNIEPVNLPGYSVSKLARVMRLPSTLARKLIAFSTRHEAEGKSSMAQDFSKQKGKNEIAEINGTIVESAEKLGIETPANRHLLKIINEVSATKGLHEKYIREPYKVCEGFKG